MRTVLAVIAVVIVVAGGAFLLFHHSSTNPNDNMGNMATSSSSQNSNAAPSATNKVTIQNFAFSPASITVKKGATVTWTNQDSTTHTVTESDSQTGPNSGNLSPGKSYSFTYNTVGTFKYHCSIHPDMTGTVTVTE